MIVSVIDNHDGEGNFPTFKIGSEVTVIEDCQFYLNWQKCIIENLVTYVPKSYITNGKLNCEYNPTELICKVGDTVTIDKIVYGWIYGKCNDQVGWIPCYKCISI